MKNTFATTTATPIMTTRVAVVFAIAAGLAIGNLYWIQPLLAIITYDLHVSTADGGYLTTALQLGYALGIFFLVPLGDIVSRKGLVTATVFASAAALLLCAISFTFSMMMLCLGVLGVVTVAGQILLPLSGDLAAPDDRGRIVGIVTSGITVGILFARFFSGMIAEWGGWPATFICAAALNGLAAIVIWQVVPAEKRSISLSYRRLLLDVFGAVRRNPKALLLLLYTGLGFGISFTVFWTALTYMLADAPYGYTPFQIGLVSLTSLVGAFAGIGLGRLQDKGKGSLAMGASFAVAAVTLLISIFNNHSIMLTLLTSAVFSLGIQGICVIGQSALFALSDTERSRLNTAMVVSNFIFASLGSILSTELWNYGGWPAAAVGAAAASVMGLLIWYILSKRSGRY